MSSSLKFPSGLSKWALNDKPEMDDFVNDNRLLDESALWKTAYDADGSINDAGGISAAIEAAISAAMPTMVQQVLAKTYPIGSYYISELDTDPAVFLEFGVWERVSGGRMLVGVDEEDTDFAAPGLRGGSKTHTLSASEMPIHQHGTVAANSGAARQGTFGSSAGYWMFNETNMNPITGSAGGSQPHNNMPPFETVYIWKRIS